MLVSEVIDNVKAYCCDIDAFTGKPIAPETTRDKVTYGDISQECSGVVVCIWPTVEIIRRAQELKANLIITHEALFWNHGDHQSVVVNNSAFQEKKKLLDQWGGAIWRCHDYIHAGVPLETDCSLVDGIFYGFAWKLGWIDYRVGNRFNSLDYEIPEMTGHELAEYLVKTLGLKGTRVVGNWNSHVKRVRIPLHIMGGQGDTDVSNSMDSEKVDALVSMEMIDFTTCQYVRDAAMLGQSKCAIQIGHFNLEEPGMEYMAKWLPSILGDNAPEVSFVPMGDTYQYVQAQSA